ncbi:hypothetical protein BJ165DRAFT_1572574 [Panaeolus papilionaceus]|nr:hypothetical protein BJ165DRAFT_1572574 [Panaeolus papilionaceus]
MRLRSITLITLSFDTCLYAILDHDVLRSKHRSRFFRPMELFWSSTHLPAALFASFIKRPNSPPLRLLLRL